jgi:rubrerythrin
MSVFNIAEVIDMGIEKEKKRRDFYGLVSEKFNNKLDLKDLFGRLRDWEDQHIKKFTQIRESVNIDEAMDSYPGELEEYMKALVEDRIYSEVSPVNFSKNVTSPLIARQYGIGFEKDAILFFKELLKYMEPVHRQIVAELIDEEKQHIIYLVALRKNY